MLKIRLMRIGAKKRPFYRVVVVDERAKRTGGYIENLGTYNPLTEPKEIKLNKDRIDYWIKQGAQPSDGYLRIIGKAPQRPPRKPKKQKVSKEEEVKTSDSIGTKVSEGEAKTEEKPAEEAPKEQTPADEATQKEETQPVEEKPTEPPAETAEVAETPTTETPKEEPKNERSS